VIAADFAHLAHLAWLVGGIGIGCLLSLWVCRLIFDSLSHNTQKRLAAEGYGLVVIAVPFVLAWWKIGLWTSARYFSLVGLCGLVARCVFEARRYEGIESFECLLAVPLVAAALSYSIFSQWPLGAGAFVLLGCSIALAIAVGVLFAYWSDREMPAPTYPFYPEVRSGNLHVTSDLNRVSLAFDEPDPVLLEDAQVDRQEPQQRDETLSSEAAPESLDPKDLRRRKDGVLRALYGLVHGDPRQAIRVGDLVRPSGLRRDELFAALRSLAATGFIVLLEVRQFAPTDTDFVVALSKKGVTRVEDLRKSQKHKGGTTIHQSGGTVQIGDNNSSSTNIGVSVSGDHARTGNISEVRAVGHDHLVRPTKTPEELVQIHAEIGLLRAELARRMTASPIVMSDGYIATPDSIGDAIGVLTSADKAIGDGNEEAAKSALSRAGHWLGGFAKDLGTTVLSDFIRSAAGLPPH